MKIEPPDPRNNIVIVLLTNLERDLFATGKLTAFFIV